MDKQGVQFEMTLDAQDCTPATARRRILAALKRMQAVAAIEHPPATAMCVNVLVIGIAPEGTNFRAYARKELRDAAVEAGLTPLNIREIQ